MVICSPYLLRGHPLDFSILSVDLEEVADGQEDG
jgi:hypothetical protein